jgi:hypothetical protein
MNGKKVVASINITVDSNGHFDFELTTPTGQKPRESSEGRVPVGQMLKEMASKIQGGANVKAVIPLNVVVTNPCVWVGSANDGYWFCW